MSRIAALKKAAIPEDPALRTLSLATLINTFGHGLFLTIEVLYFTFHVGLSPSRVALGLSIAGGVALIFGVTAGHFADRFGPRDLAALSFIAEGALLIGFIFIHSFLPFLLLSVAVGVAGAIGQTLRMATIASFGEGEERVRVRAYTRAITNLGIALGTVFSGIALAINTGTAYSTMLVFDSLTFFVAAAVFHRLPYVAPTISKGEPFSFIALKDKKYLTVTMLNGVMSLHFILQSVAIPLWVVKETNAPRWWVAVIMLINTIGVIFLQVPASKGSGEVRNGAKKFERAGFYVAIACLLYALSSGVPRIPACALLVVAMFLHVLGEVESSVGSWSIGFGLADPKHRGQYQGVFSLGFGLSGAIGPSFVTALAIGMGKDGWIILAVIFILSGMAMRRIVSGSWIGSQQQIIS
ncbi:MAG: MFS transporter [Actinomycetota bacterium]